MKELIIIPKEVITRESDKIIIRLCYKKIDPIKLINSCFKDQLYIERALLTYSSREGLCKIILTRFLGNEDITIEKIFSEIRIKGQPIVKDVESWLSIKDNESSVLAPAILDYALKNQEVINDSSKQESILKALESNNQKPDFSCYFLYPSLTAGSITSLLGLGFDPKTIANFALQNSMIQADPVKQESILKALKGYKLYPSDCYLYNSNITSESISVLLDYGVAPMTVLNFALETTEIQNDPVKLENILKLLDKLTINFYDPRPDLDLESFSVLLKTGFNPQKMLDFALYNPEIQAVPEKQEGILKLLVGKEVYCDSYCATPNITEASISILHTFGLDQKQIIESKLNPASNELLGDQGDN